MQVRSCWASGHSKPIRRGASGIIGPMNNRFRFVHPKYWPTWAGYLVLQLIVRLPHGARLAVGSMLGRITGVIAVSRRHVVETNLRLCFPDLDDDARRRLVLETFRSGGISIIETAVAWLLGGRPVLERATLEGLEHLEKARAEGKGVLLLGTHMSTLDLAGSVLSRSATFDVMYRANKNELMESIMTSGRARLYPHPIERGDVRQVIRNLKAGHVVWYGPDQDYGARNAVFTPFFGVPAATTTALSRIARITGSPVVPFSHFRVDGGRRYRVVLYEPLANFPSDSEAEDTRRINAFVEDCVRQAPEQYWWFHRRFKTRPEGVTNVY